MNRIKSISDSSESLAFDPMNSDEEEILWNSVFYGGDEDEDNIHYETILLQYRDP